MEVNDVRAGVEMESLLKDAGWRAYWTPPREQPVHF
jgi:hypothetical protein